LSANIHRRHLTAEQKRESIAKVLKAQPSKSNRTIAKQAKVDDKTVAVVRGKLEATAEIPQLTKTIGADGKTRTTTPTRKKCRTVDDFVADKKARRPAEPLTIEVEYQEIKQDDVEADKKAQEKGARQGDRGSRRGKVQADTAHRRAVQQVAQAVQAPKQSDLEHVLPDAGRLVLEIIERDRIAPG